MQNALEITAMPSQASAASMRTFAFYRDFSDQYEANLYSRFMIEDTDLPTEIERWLESPDNLVIDDMIPEWKLLLHLVPYGTYPVKLCSCLKEACFGCNKVYMMTDCRTASLVEATFTFSTLTTPESQQVIEARELDNSRSYFQAVEFANAVVRSHSMLRALRLKKFDFICKYGYGAMRDGDYDLAMAFLRKHGEVPEIFKEPLSSSTTDYLTPTPNIVAQIGDINLNMNIGAGTIAKFDSLLDMLQTTISAFTMKAGHMLLLSSIAVNLILFFKSGCSFTSLCLALANVVMTVGIPTDLVSGALTKIKDLASQAYSYFFPDSPELPTMRFAQGPAETLLPLGSLVVSILSVGLLKKLPSASDLTAYAQHFAVFGRAVQGLKSITEVVQDIVLKSFSWCYERWYGVPYELKDYTASVPELQEYFNSVAELVALDEKKKIQNNVEVCKRVEDVYVKGLGIQRRLANIKAPSQVMSTFSTHHMIMTRLYSEVDKSGAFNSGPRVPPVVVQLFGSSGVGKSGCAFPLMQDVLREDGLHKDWANHIYQRNTEQEFWDGYDNQRVCYYDDFGQLRDNQLAPNAEFMEIIRTANIAPYPLHRAELADKARSRFSSRLVLLTSNCQTFPTPSLTCPEAFLRRVDFAYRVDIDDRVAYRQVVNGAEQKRIDPLLVQNVYGVPMTTDIYKFYRVDKRTLQAGQVSINYQEMITEITQAYRARFYENNNVVDYLNQRVAQVNDKFFDVSEDYVKYEAEFMHSCMTKSPRLEFTSHGFTSDSTEDLQALVDLDFSNPFVGMEIESRGLHNSVFILEEEEELDSSRLQWLKTKAKECVTSLSEFAKFILEKAKLCPVRTVLMAAAVVVPLIVRFWPQPKSECRMNAALQKVLTQDTHWNIVNAFGTRTCFRKCAVCDAIKAGGAPVLGSQDSMRDVVARMIAKLRHIPPFGNEILVESNDCLTRKVSAVVESVKESVDDLTGSIAQESNDNRTIKVALPRVESASDDVIGQGLLDVNAQELFQNKVLRNTYRITRERSGRHTVLMNLAFIKGVCAITAGHFLNHVQSGDIIHLSNIYLKSVSLPWNSIQVVTPAESDQDVCLLIFPKDFMPMQVDITKHFVDDHHLVEVSGGAVTLSTFRQANISGMKDIPTFLNCPRVEAHNKMIHYADTIARRTVQQRDYYRYFLDTKSGDCGSLIGVRTNMIPRKLIGLHVAGEPGIGYAVPLSQRRIQALLAAVPTLAQVSMDVDFSPVSPPPGDFLPLFTVPPSEALSSVRKSSLVQTPLFDVLEQHTMDRAHLRPIGEIDPMEKSLEKAGGNLVYISPEKITKVENAVKHKLSPSGTCRVLSYREAIEGVVGDEWICPVNRMASAGYPWALHANGQPGKTKWLGKGEDYCFDNEELLAEVTKAEDMMKRGERPLFIFQDTLKDEKRPVEKVESVKTRTFAACPLPLVLLFRKYFLDAVKCIMVGRNYNEIAVGTNVYSMDWAVIARLLSSKGKKVIAGDFSNFDGSLQPQILRAVERILESFYQDVATPDETMIRSMLFNEVVNSIHIRGKDVYMWTHSQPSGGPLTVIINSIYNALVMRLCWVDIMGDKFSMRDFERCVSLNTYGDDNVANISDEVIDTYNQETISEAMKTFGMTYTDESKSGKIVPWRQLSEVSFLKRRFVRRGFFYDAPLETRTLHEMVQWTRKSVDIHEATAVTVEGAAMEWAMHGKDVYDYQVGRLREACKAHLQKQPFLLTFEEVMQELDGHKC